MKPEINSYQALLLEKKKLESHILDTEVRLKNKWRDLRKHYPEMILKPSLPFEQSTNEKVYKWMEWLNEFLFSSIMKENKKGIKQEATKFIVRAAQVWAIRTVSKYFTKKRNHN